MNKPISVIINETRDNILQICNQSTLHPSILELIVKDLCYEIAQFANNQSQKEKMNYENTLREMMNENSVEVECKQEIK